MKEARYLGDRIGLISNGKLKLVGPPSFYAAKFKHSITLKFTLPTIDDEDAREQKLDQLKVVINEAIAASQRHLVKSKVNSLNQLVLKLPQGIQYHSLSECVNIPQLHME